MFCSIGSSPLGLLSTLARQCDNNVSYSQGYMPNLKLDKDDILAIQVINMPFISLVKN